MTDKLAELKAKAVGLWRQKNVQVRKPCPRCHGRRAAEGTRCARCLGHGTVVDRAATVLKRYDVDRALRTTMRQIERAERSRERCQESPHTSGCDVESATRD